MKISQRIVAILLNEEGSNVVQITVPELSNSPVLFVYVQDTDDLGLWVRIEREDGEHVVLIRWEFVLSIDFPAGETRTVGLKA